MSRVRRPYSPCRGEPVYGGGIETVEMSSMNVWTECADVRHIDTPPDRPDTPANFPILRGNLPFCARQFSICSVLQKAADL
jgi:hypothetical protein